MREPQNETLECPTSVAGVLEVIKVLMRHEVNAVTVRPGVAIEVQWIKHSADERLLSPAEHDLKAVLGAIDLEEFGGSTTDVKALFTDALLNLSFRGLVANIILVSSLRGFKQALNIPELMPLPRVGPRRIPILSGMRILEVDDTLFVGDRFVLLAAPFQTDDPTLAVFGLSVVY